MPKIFASIDIGSNAVRLLFAGVFRNGDRVISEKATLVRIPVRLGMDVFETGFINEQRKQMLVTTLQAFKLLVEVYQPLGLKACATAAMREATNREEILQEIIQKTGIPIEIIDGHEEARLISASNNFDLDITRPYTLYVDVGGGSTELSLYHQNTCIQAESFKIGTIRLMNNKVDPEVWVQMKKWIAKHLPRKAKVNCIGSGGNINKLVKLFGQYESSHISRKKLKSAWEQLKDMSMEQRAIQFGLRSDRADVIVPAAEIFLQITQWGQISKIIAPKFGLADGIAIEQFKAFEEKSFGNQ